MLARSASPVSLLLLLCAAAAVCSVSAVMPLYESRNGGLYADGQRFHIRGINWFGFECKDYVLHGLWSVSMESILDKLAALHFNALRVPLSAEMVLNNPLSISIDFAKNPNMQGKHALEILDLVVSAAASRGMLVMFDMHALTHDGLSQEGLWYTSAYPESSVLRMWDTLIARYNSSWNVFAADIKNEPWASTWGSGDQATDFRLAAQRIGSHIAERSGWLVFVEGIGSKCGGQKYPWCYWGEGLNSAGPYPVVLSVANRLVYSPHAYTKSIGDMSYYHDPSYPQMMPDVWGEHFGFLRALNSAAVVPGEWGGDPNANSDTKVWMTAWVSYLNKADITDNFFWCVNPNSGDTGGLFGNDWSTVDVSGRLFFINQAQSSPFSFAEYAAAGGTPGKHPTAGPTPGPVSSTAPTPAPQPSTAPQPQDSSSTLTPAPPTPSSTAAPTPVGTCSFVATDVGSNGYWLAFSIASTKPGGSAKKVVAVRGGQSLALDGPFNWGAGKQAVFTANVNTGSAWTAPLALLVTDAADASVSTITISAFGDGKTFSC